MNQYNIFVLAWFTTSKAELDFYNYFHNILRPLDVLLNFLFTKSETMRDYYL